MEHSDRPRAPKNYLRNLVGGEIKQWLASMLPNEVTTLQLGGGFGYADLDGNDGDGDLFSLDNYGASLMPSMTPELEERINKNVKDAHASLER